jgi:NADH-quinone oxidoreductase subunit I
MMAIVVKRQKLNLLERLFLWEVIRGMIITFRHFLVNLFNINKVPTLNYPEQKRVLAPNFRAQHRLLAGPGGYLKCTACRLCSQACPVGCITIEAGPHPDPQVKKKYPARYEIDISRCIFCNFCVEACPFEAIDMNSGRYELAAPQLSGYKLNREALSSDQGVQK